jgi:hypothetical protein
MENAMSQQRFGVDFMDGDHKISVVYWIDNGRVMGEAYFHKDDHTTPIRNGTFHHLFSSVEYKLHTPCGEKWPDAVLDKQVWKEVGRGKPGKAV